MGAETMDRSIVCRCHRYLAAILCLLGTAAVAGPLPVYRALDLGIGEGQITTDAAGNRVALGPVGGTEYAFPQSSVAFDAAATGNALPKLTNAPVWSPMTYGNPINAYSFYSEDSFHMNRNGVLVGTNVVGVSGHIASASTNVFAATRQPDGSFGSITPLWNSPNNASTGGPMAWPIGINVKDQVLGTSANFGNYDRPTFQLFDLRTGTQTDVEQLLPGWTVRRAMGIDDQGRILIAADSQASKFQEHTFLLTPDGVSAQTITVPEPSALALLALGLAGVARGRRRVRKSGGDIPGAIC